MKKRAYNNKMDSGFKGQIYFVLPRPFVKASLGNPLLRGLCATDLGWYPCAGGHYRARPKGAEEHILIVCYEGSGFYTVGDKSGTLKSGQALLIPVGVPHVYEAASDIPWSILFLHFIGDDSTYYLSRVTGDGFVFSVSLEVLPRFKNLFYDAFAVLNEGFSPMNITHASQMVRHALSHLFHANPGLSHREATVIHRDFGAVMDFMKKNLNRTIALEELSHYAKLSVARFSVLFQHQTGCSPVSYHLRLRIQEACRIFNLGGRSIKEIAVHCGYEDPYHFSRVFKKVMGMSPRTYLKIKSG